MEEASTETDDMVRVLESAEELSGKQVVMTSTREKNVITNLTAVCETGTDAVAHKSIGPEEFVVRGNIISTRCVTLANRTVKIIKYEVETNGLVEIRTEYFVAIHSGANIDHDAELNEAILLATNMNPNMTVEETQLKLES
ncbi:Protein 4.1 -like protein [Toxocara canis]|uniref:Protein 4.1-like protein n=1 Tax=Toxocara canis TaxID=6265 RepID=A0A0B2V9L5_TOXCA|nr:Protein 4.1 -like protein [Toxocara canis]